MENIENKNVEQNLNETAENEQYKAIDIIGGALYSIGADMLVSSILGPYTIAGHGIKAFFIGLGKQGISSMVSTAVCTHMTNHIRKLRIEVKHLFGATKELKDAIDRVTGQKPEEPAEEEPKDNQ